LKRWWMSSQIRLGVPKSSLALTTTSVEFHAIPLTEEKRGGKKKDRFDRQAFAQFLFELCKKSAVEMCIEDIWGFGVQHKKQNANSEVRTGSTSMFNFARDYGALICATDIFLTLKKILGILDLTVSYVSPQRWQKRVGKKGDKKASIARAQELYPDAQLIPLRCRVPSDGRAEALLIAHYIALENDFRPGVYVGIDPGLKGAICVLTVTQEAV
jgi:hypothetical protein